MNNKKNVIIADNQELTRNGIIAILDKHYDELAFEIVENKEHLFIQAQKNIFQVLIIDHNLFDFHEISELAKIKNYAPGIEIIVVSEANTPEDVYKVLNLGIKIFILKSSSAKDLLDAFSAARENKRFISVDVAEILMEQKVTPRPVKNSGQLTPAEVDIVRLIAQGLTTKSIAAQKGLSFHTIITHRKNIFKKLNINCTSELLMYAMKAGLIDPDFCI